MQTTKPTSESIKKWKSLYSLYKDRLVPNKKTIVEIIGYLKSKYSVTELEDPRLKSVVTDNVMQNTVFAAELSKGVRPQALVYKIENLGNGKTLYDGQDAIYKGCPIIVGFETQTEYFLVEGSAALWDELFALRGLDENDLKNYYLVAEYVTCLQKAGKL